MTYILIPWAIAALVVTNEGTILMKVEDVRYQSKHDCELMLNNQMTIWTIPKENMVCIPDVSIIR